MVIMKRAEEQLIEVTSTFYTYSNLKELITYKEIENGEEVVDKEEYDKTMGKVQYELNTKGIHGSYTVDDLLEAIENRIIIPSCMQSYKKKYKKKDGTDVWKYVRTFVQSNIIFIDVDNYTGDMGAEYKKGLQNLSIGFIHSPSGDNCYRLVFILDAYITDKANYKIMHKYICNMLSDYDFADCIDRSNNSSLSLVRIGKGYKYFDKNVRVNYSMYIEYIQKEIEEQFAKKYINNTTEYDSGIITTDVEVNHRIEIMSNKETDYDTWFAMVQAIRSQIEDEDEAMEAARKASEDRNNPKFERDLRNIFNNDYVGYTWGIFITICNSCGYKPSLEVTQARREAAKKAGMLKETYTHIIKNVERIKIDKYIDINVITELLSGNDTTLVDAPTGSGKSTKVIEAFKVLANESKKNIFILSVPTTPIIDSLIRDDEELIGYYAVKEDDEFYNAMGKALMLDGKQIYITTYNATHKLAKFVKHHIPDAHIRIVIDEVHDWVHAYNYRSEAINDLANVLPMIRIGLSGTSYPVDMASIFDKKVVFERENDKINADEYNVYTFKDDGNDALLATVNAIYEKLKDGDKLLLFLDNIEGGLVLADLVKQTLPNIRVATINKDNKSTSEVYHYLKNTGKLPQDIDLVISTRLLSSGVSVENAKHSHIYILSSILSQMRDTVLLRQSAARFRAQYKSINLIIQESKDEEEKPYNYEGAVSHTMYYAEAQYDRVREYEIPESMYGMVENLYHVTPHGVDELAVRHDIMLYQSYYYAKHRKALWLEFGRVLNLPINKIVDVTQKQSEKEKRKRKVVETKEERQVRMDKFKEICTQEKIDRAKQGDAYSLGLLTNNLNNDEQNTLKDILHIVKKEDDIHKIISKTTRRNAIYQYTTYLDKLLEKENVSDDSNDFFIIDEIERELEIYDGGVTTTELVAIVNKVARSAAVALPVVKDILDDYFIKISRKKKQQERAAEYIFITSKTVAEVYDIKEGDVIKHKSEYRHLVNFGKRKKKDRKRKGK
ncbi:DEAD/DEAH box helicase family protein [Viridibacillus arvi]|uniref:DEAD/DEAH box helicase family protein n=1 Tax=Viridibacillus arvi TaxID=263475 RepID=UPI003D289739